MTHFATRLVLSAAIVLSLLPADLLPFSDLWFLIFFAPEFAVRLVLTFRQEGMPSTPGLDDAEDDDRIAPARSGWHSPSWGDLGFLALDLVALLSFIPLPGHWLSAWRWLRLARLSRMLVLLRYWSPLAVDIATVLVRRERGRQVALMGTVVLVLAFTGAVVLENAPGELNVDFDDDGEGGKTRDASFWVRLWWSFRQIQDPGNMLGQPDEGLAVLVSVALTVFGIFLISFLIGLGTDVVRELVELRRIRAPGMAGHTVVVNISPATRSLLFELLRHYQKLTPDGSSWLTRPWWETTRRKMAADRRFVIVGPSSDPPDFVREAEMSSVVYRQSSVDVEELLRRTDLGDARRVVLMADSTDRDPDDETIRTMLTLVEQVAPRRGAIEDKMRLVAEIVDESNVPAARRALARLTGRVQAVIVPTERLLALFVACVARRPNVADLLLELLTSHGHELYAYDNAYPGRFSAKPRYVGNPRTIYSSLLARGVQQSPERRVIPVGLIFGSAPRHVTKLPGPDESTAGAPRPREDATTNGDGSRDAAPLGVAPSPAETQVDCDEGQEHRTLPGRGHSVSSAGDYVLLNPRVDRVREQSHVRGYVALARNFRAVAEFAESLQQRPLAPEDVFTVDGLGKALPLRTVRPAECRRILLCGFRPGSTNLVESLMVADPDAEILILVDDEAGDQDQSYRAALDAFDVHNNLVRHDLLVGRKYGVFRRIDEQAAVTPETSTSSRPIDAGTIPRKGAGVTMVHVVRGEEQPRGRGRVHVARGKWASMRRLMRLPFRFHGDEEDTSAADVDVVVFLSSERDGSDARTTTALMKLESLIELRARECETSGSKQRVPRVIVEVLDAELERRLQRRYRSPGSLPVRVFSLQKLRAFMMFQSVVVPHFELVYGELLAPWGHSFVEYRPVHIGATGEPGAGVSGRMAYTELVARIYQGVEVGGVRARGMLLVALTVELKDAEGNTKTHIAMGEGDVDDKIDLATIRGLWVISSEDA